MTKQENESIRKHLTESLSMRGAHVDLDEALAEFPAELRGKKPDGAPHTAWELLEHMRTAQEDILDFSRNADYKDKKWPEDYWPSSAAPPTGEAWDASIAQIKSDLAEMQELVADLTKNLLAKIPHGTGQTVLKEALVVMDHNSYHLGQLVLLRKMLEH